MVKCTLWSHMGEWGHSSTHS